MNPSENPPHLNSWIGRLLSWVPLVLLGLVTVGLLALLAAGGMARLTAWYLLQLVPPGLGLALLVSIGLYAAGRWLLRRQRIGRVALVTAAGSLLALSPALLMVVPVAYPASLESTQPAATVRLPADVPLQVVWGGDTLAHNNHAAVPDQRWAYDLVVAPYFGESERLEDYGCYGVPVVAPADGLVTAARDGEPDMIPGQLSNNTTAAEGNFVALQLETGTYLIIAHLQPGSVLVKVGQRVVEGQPIGKCGNSGNTSEPHIHIHHQRQDPTVFPLNFAEGLPLYFRDHDGPPMPEGGVRVEDGKAVATGPVVQHKK